MTQDPIVPGGVQSQHNSPCPMELTIQVTKSMILAHIIPRAASSCAPHCWELPWDNVQVLCFFF